LLSLNAFWIMKSGNFETDDSFAVTLFPYFLFLSFSISTLSTLHFIFNLIGESGAMPPENFPDYYCSQVSFRAFWEEN
jgi:hypothetical protein